MSSSPPVAEYLRESSESRKLAWQIVTFVFLSASGVLQGWCGRQAEMQTAAVVLKSHPLVPSPEPPAFVGVSCTAMLIVWYAGLHLCDQRKQSMHSTCRCDASVSDRRSNDFHSLSGQFSLGGPTF